MSDDHSINIRIRSIHSQENAKASLQNNIYKLACVYFEEIGEREGYLQGNGHHMAQDLAQRALDIWEDHIIQKPS